LTQGVDQLQLVVVRAGREHLAVASSTAALLAAGLVTGTVSRHAPDYPFPVTVPGWHNRARFPSG